MKNLKLRQVIFLLLSTIFSFSLLAQNDVNKSKGDTLKYNLTNITKVAKSIQMSGGEIHLADYTGFESDNQYEDELISVATEVRNTLGFDIYDLGLWPMMSYTNEGVNQSITKIQEDITSEKYVLYHYNVLADQNMGDITFVVVDNTVNSSKDDVNDTNSSGVSTNLSTVASIINSQLNHFMGDEFSFVKRVLVEKLTLEYFLNFMNSDDIVLLADDAGKPVRTEAPSYFKNYVALSGIVFHAPDISFISFRDAVHFKHNPDNSGNLDVRGMVYSFYYKDKQYTPRRMPDDPTKFKGYATGFGVNKKYYEPQLINSNGDVEAWVGFNVSGDCPEGRSTCNYQGFLVKLNTNRSSTNEDYSFYGSFYSFSELEDAISMHLISIDQSNTSTAKWNNFNSFDDVGVLPNYSTKRSCVPIPRNLTAFQEMEYLAPLDTSNFRSFTIGKYNGKFLLTSQFKGYMYGYELDAESWEPTGDLYYKNLYCGEWYPLKFHNPDDFFLPSVVLGIMKEINYKKEFTDVDNYIMVGQGVLFISGIVVESPAILIAGIGYGIYEGVIQYQNGDKGMAYLSFGFAALDALGLSVVKKGAKFFIVKGGKKTISLIMRIVKGSKAGKMIDFYKLIDCLPAKAQKEILGDILKITDVVESNKLLVFFAQKGKKGVKAWEVLNDAGTALKTDVIALGKIAFLKTKGLTDAQLLKIGKLNDIKCLNIADNLAKRIAPPVPQSVLDKLDLIVSKGKSIEQYDVNILNKLEEITSNANFKNPVDLESNLTRAYTDMSNGTKGFSTEVDEAIRGLADGETISLGKINTYGNELDVVSESGQWLQEVKRIESSNSSKFTKRLNDIGKKFNKDSKLNLGERDFYRNNGGLKGVIEIGNTSNPVFIESFSQVQNRINNIISDNTIPLYIREGLNYSKSITVIRGADRLHFVKGIHY